MTVQDLIDAVKRDPGDAAARTALVQALWRHGSVLTIDEAAGVGTQWYAVAAYGDPRYGTITMPLASSVAVGGGGSE